MPAKGQKHDAAARARIAEGTKRGLRPWRGALQVLPSHVRAFMARGEVHESLRAAVTDATMLIGEYADELGGETALTVGQRAMLAKLWRAVVAANGQFATYLRRGDASALEGIGVLLSDERHAIGALGLARRAREIDPTQPVDVQWGDEDEDDAAPLDAPAASDAARESTPRASGDRGSERDSGDEGER